MDSPASGTLSGLMLYKFESSYLIGFNYDLLRLIDTLHDVAADGDFEDYYPRNSGGFFCN